MTERKIEFKVVYNVKNKLLSDGTALIQIRATKDRERKYFSTGIYIKPDQWDEHKQRVKLKPRETTARNDSIKNQLTTLETLETQLILTKKTYSVSDLKEAYQAKDLTTNKQREDFALFILDEIETDGSITERTKKRLRSAVSTLQLFAGKKTPFTRLNYEFLDRFYKFLTNAQNKKPNTVLKQFSIMNKYARKAVKLQYIEQGKNPFEDYKVKGEKTNKIALTVSELTKIEKLKFTKAEKHLERTKDFFLFMCYTGFRYSDASTLNYFEVTQEKDGIVISKKTSEKEDKPFYLPLKLLFDGKPETLIKKYWRTDKKPFFCTEKGTVLKDQTANKQLKEIQLRAGINTNLTNHVARHTFCTAIVKKVPLYVVQRLAQHSDIKTTMQYIHANNTDVIEELNKVKNWT